MNYSVISLMKNEIIKLHKKKKILICIVILVLASFIVVVHGSGQGIKDYRQQLKEAQYQLDKSTEIGDKNNWSKSVGNLKNSIEAYHLSVEAPISEVKNYYNKQVKKLQSMEKNNDINGKSYDDPIIENDINYIRYLNYHNLRPTNDIELDSNGYMKDAIGVFSLISIILVLIIASDMISDEFLAGTIKILITRPVSRMKIIFSKFVSSVALCSSLVLIFEIGVFLLGGVIKSFSSLNYPEKVLPIFEYSNKYGFSIPIKKTGTIIPEWKLFIYCFMLQVLFIICLSAFFIMMSCLIKNSVYVILSSMLVIIIGFLFQIFEGLKFYSGMLFMNYCSVINIVTRKVEMDLGTYYVSILEAITILILYTAVFLFISKKSMDKELYV